MRNNHLIIAIALLALIPGIATASELVSVTGNADCNGWNASAVVDFDPDAMMVRLEYAVVLVDPDGVESERIEFSEYLEIPETTPATYSFAGAWTSALGDGFSAAIDFALFDFVPDDVNVYRESLNFALACGAGGVDDPPATDVCRERIRFWRRNADQWPVDSLELGSETVGHRRLMKILHHRHGHRIMLRLSRQLIAAKLNMAAGAGDEIAETIAAADDLLARNGLTARNFFRSRPDRESRREARRLKYALRMYNISGCPTEMGTYLKSAVPLEDELDVEEVNFGTVKSLYR